MKRFYFDYESHFSLLLLINIINVIIKMIIIILSNKNDY